MSINCSHADYVVFFSFLKGIDAGIFSPYYFHDDIVVLCGRNQGKT